MRRIMLVLAMATTLAVTAVGVSVAQIEEDEALPIAGMTCDGGTIELNSTEERILDLHNQVRADNGLSPLCVNPILTDAARAHSQDMLDEGYFSHTSPDGETYPARLERFGYTSTGYGDYAVGENIGEGSGSLGEPDAIFEKWMNSSDHRDNILSEGFQEIGIGARVGNVTMYTVDFGTRQ